MKKFLVILMVVAMASFLFVGCMPGVTPDVDEDEDEVPAVAKSEVPTITDINSVSLYSTADQYTKSITVTGVSVKDATIKMYVDDVQVGVDVTGDSATFGPIAVTMAKVTEGEVELYVTATEKGLTESDASTKYTFTYDKTKPTLASAVADSGDNTITVTFSEDVSTVLSDSDYWSTSALNSINWFVNSAALDGNDVVSKLTDKKIRITRHVDIDGSVNAYYVQCVDVVDMADNAMVADSTVSVGVTAIPTP